MEAGSIRQRKRCFPNNLDPSRRICFPILCTNRSSREQSANGESNFAFTPAWQTQSWYPLMLQLTLEVPLLLPIILGLNGEKHPFDREGKITTPGMGSLRKRLHAEGKTLPLLSQMPQDQVQIPTTNSPGVSSIAGVVYSRLIPLCVL